MYVYDAPARHLQSLPDGSSATLQCAFTRIAFSRRIKVYAAMALLRRLLPFGLLTYLLHRIQYRYGGGQPILVTGLGHARSNKYR